jgi:5-formyltetrahydrofolate cyclo-ligase
MNKPELRRLVRQRLAALTPEARAEKSAAIARVIATSPEWHAARTIGLFAPLPSEPNIDLLWPALAGKEACYPRIDGQQILFLRVPDRAALLPTSGNLFEPPHSDEAIVPPAAFDLILVPGVAFTQTGERLGRGGGYYDRLLADPTLRAATFGIGFSEQLFPALPCESHDRSVQRVITA